MGVWQFGGGGGKRVPRRPVEIDRGGDVRMG